MDERTDTIFERWLAAERRGRDGEAERALAGLFAALPAAAPSAGFADRVLAAVVAGPATYPWWSRAAIAVCVLLAGLAAALILPLAASLARLVAPGEAIGGLIQAFVALVGRVDELLSAWRVWASVVDTALLIATAPPVVLVLLTLTVLSALTFRGLERALVADRSQDHVSAC